MELGEPRAPGNHLPCPMGNRNSLEFPLFLFPFLCCASSLFIIEQLCSALTQSWCLPAQVSGHLPEAGQEEQRTKSWKWGNGHVSGTAGLGSGCEAVRAHGPWGIILLTETFPSYWPQAVSSQNGSLIGSVMHLSLSTHFLALGFPSCSLPQAGPEPCWSHSAEAMTELPCQGKPWAVAPQK